MGGEVTMVGTDASGERSTMDNIRQGRSTMVALRLVMFDEKRSNCGKVHMADVVWQDLTANKDDVIHGSVSCVGKNDEGELWEDTRGDGGSCK